MQTIPYIVYEGAQARNERTVKRLIIALVIAVLITFITNGLWLYMWSQYDYTSEEITVDAQDGMANYIGERGNINIGTDYSETKEPD